MLRNVFKPEKHIVEIDVIVKLDIVNLGFLIENELINGFHLAYKAELI